MLGVHKSVPSLIFLVCIRSRRFFIIINVKKNAHMPFFFFFFIIFADGKCWDDERCDINRPFVCEKRIKDY